MAMARTRGNLTSVARAVLLSLRSWNPTVAFSCGIFPCIRSCRSLQPPTLSLSFRRLALARPHHLNFVLSSSATATRYRPFPHSTIAPTAALAMPSSSSSSSSSASTFSPSGNLVSIPQAIRAHKNNTQSEENQRSKNIFIDGSWHMPTGTSPRNARSEYSSGPRIPGARYFDIDDVAPSPGGSSNPKGLPHMKPSFLTFARAMDRMKISHDDVLYIYATEGCAFAHRAYWTFAFCGYHDPEKVKLVQGSLNEWKERGGELEYGELHDDYLLFRMEELDDWEDSSTASGLNYKCWKDLNANDNAHSEVVMDMDEVLAVISDNGTSDAIIVDARSAGRFYGRDPEPRPGLRGGHMPGAVNVPFASLLTPEDVTKFRPMEEVREIFINAGIKPLEEDGSVPRKVICSCGSGVTAAALAVGLEECGLRKKEEISIYDGSWIDWGGSDSTPIVTE